MEIRPDEEVLKTNHQQHETINIQNQNRITKNTLTNQLTEPKINRMCMESANHSGLYPDIKMYQDNQSGINIKQSNASNEPIVRHH